MSIPLLQSSTQGIYEVIGTPIMGANQLSVNSAYVMTANTVSFTGQVLIDATLLSTPSNLPNSNDWFTVANATLSNSTGTTQFSFSGTYAWLRARLSRAYLNISSPSQNTINSLGYINDITIDDITTYGYSEGISYPIGSHLTISYDLQGVAVSNTGTGSDVISNVVINNGIAILNTKTIAGANGISIIDDGNTITILSNTVVSKPAMANSTGIFGQWATDGSYLYICTAANTWKRVAISSF